MTSADAVAGLGIAAVERDTGLSKDLLRVWERRYGFPSPDRDHLGERLYSVDQVQRLRWIKRLLDAGARPSHVVALSPEALQQRLQALEPASAREREPGRVGAEELDALLEPLLNHQLYALQEALQAQLLKRGLGAYVTEVLAPLIAHVGQLWTQGRVQIFEEHLFTEVVQQQLHRAMAMLPTHERMDRPRVLLGTVPGEEHGLGLLMVQSLLALSGCQCISLGLQTPLDQIVSAARAQRADVLALSFSAYASAALVDEALGHLLNGLPADSHLWAGGAAAALRRHVQRDPRLLVITALEQVPEAVNAWRRRALPGV
jgi:methanogenic corrinoid protein MtbC1